MGWHESLREQRKEAILEAAAEVFAQKGYHRATIKEIAARVGIAPGTIYLYFESKRALLLSIADRLITQRVSEVLEQASSLDAQGYIAAVLQERLDFFRRNQPFLQALATEVWTDESLRRRFFTQVLAPVFASGARYLEKKVAEGVLRPCRVEIVAPAVAGSIILISLLRIFVPEYTLADVPEDELIEELTRLYLDGLSARGEGE